MLVSNTHITLNLCEMSEEKTFSSKYWRRTYIAGPIIVGVTLAIFGIMVAKVDKIADIGNLFKSDKTAKIKTILTNYANDLNDEKLNTYKYFSSSVETFINLSDTDPTSISNSLRKHYYPHYLFHRVKFNLDDLKVEEKGDEYIVELTEEDSFVWYKTNEERNPRFHVTIRFDEDLKIKSFIQKEY